MRLSAVWYDVGYDIQRLNMAMCFEILIFFGRSMFCEVVFFFYSSKKPHSNHVYPRFNNCSIVTYVINNRWYLILSRRSDLVDSLQNIIFFVACHCMTMACNYHIAQNWMSERCPTSHVAYNNSNCARVLIWQQLPNIDLSCFTKWRKWVRWINVHRG